MVDVADGRAAGSIPTKTMAPFIPRGQVALSRLLAEFDGLQGVQIACVGAADGLDLGRLWIRSPFNTRIRYNAYSCLSILPRHQHRHLWQAEQVWSSLNPPAERQAPRAEPGL